MQDTSPDIHRDPQRGWLHPSLGILGMAAAAAGLVWVFTSQAPDALARCLLAAGLVLISRDTLDSVQAGFSEARGTAALRDPRRWLYAWLFAAFFTAFMTVFQWQGASAMSDGMAINAALGASVGLILAFVTRGAAPFAAPFDLSRPADPPGWQRWLIYGWPFAVTILLTGVVWLADDDHWNPLFSLVQMVLYPFIMMMFPIKGGFIDAIEHHLPRLIGIVLTVAPILMA